MGSVTRYDKLQRSATYPPRQISMSFNNVNVN